MTGAKLFSEMLLLEASGNYTTSEQIHKAIVKFDDLPKSQQPTEAKKILKSAEKINYLIRAEKILKYKNVKVEPQKEKKDDKSKESLFDLTRTNKIEKVKGESVDQKEASKIIKKHISQRFPFAKFSVTSDGNAIRISLKSSPFAEDSKYNKSIMEYVEQYAKSLNHRYDPYVFTSKWGMVKTEDNKELQSQFDVVEQENDKQEEIEYRKRVAEQEKQRELDKIRYEKQRIIDEKNTKSIEDNVKVVDVDDPYFVYKVKFAKLNKNQTIGEYESEVNSGEYNTRKVKVEREVNFDNKKDFDNFSNMLLHDFSFLSQQGGTYSDDPRFADFDNLSKEERSTIDFYDTGVMIKYKNKDMYFVDSQGYDYARYVGFLPDNYVQRNVKPKPSKEEVKSKVDELSDDELEKLMELMKQLKK